MRFARCTSFLIPSANPLCRERVAEQAGRIQWPEKAGLGRSPGGSAPQQIALLRISAVPGLRIIPTASLPHITPTRLSPSRPYPVYKR